MRPEEPQSYRDLATVLAQRWENPGWRLAHPQQADQDISRAMALLHQVVFGRWDQRLSEIEVIALMELNRLMAKVDRLLPEDRLYIVRPELDSRLAGVLDVGLRIVLNWDSDLTDVDLWVTEPTGNHVFFSHPRSAIGGLLSRDFTQGYGPEEYVLKQPIAGEYAVRAKYYGSRQRTLLGPVTVKAVSFTGSTRVGRIIANSISSKLKKVSLELGGKDPVIICADCDIEVAAKGAAWGGFMNAGQVCTSVERVYVFDEVADSFTEALVEEAKKVNIGDPMDTNTDMGPMASSVQYEKAHEKVGLAVDQGARLLTGGGRPDAFDKGYFYEPTVFDNMTAEMELMNEEAFSPVVPIQKVKSLEEAIEFSNATKYGLGCSIYTKDIELAMTAADDIKAGSFWINNPLSENNAAPFGGMKMSGQGRELGIEGLDEFREPKHILIDYRQEKKDWWFPYGSDGD